MRKEFTKDGFCNCGLPKRWTKGPPHFPLKYDEEMNEYSIARGQNKDREALMYYCFFCGGKLPKSKRDSQFTKPRKNEIQEMSL